MWWLYTHDCNGGRWTLLTQMEQVGRPLKVPDQLAAVGHGFYVMGHHLGLRYTQLLNVGQEVMDDRAAVFMRVMSVTTSKPPGCRYQEPDALEKIDTSAALSSGGPISGLYIQDDDD